MPLKAAIVPVTPFQQNCTLLWDEESKAGAIVDPGGDLERIEEAIARHGLRPEKILLTHGHLDHAAGADELKERLGGVPIEGPHIADKFLLEGLAAQAAAFGHFSARNVTPDRWLKEGDSVNAAGTTFSCCTVPAIRRARWCWSTADSASPSSATCCFAARSAARIFPMATMRR